MLSKLRNRNLARAISSTLLIIMLIIYESLGSIFLYLPPLFGALYIYFCHLIEDNRYYTILFFTITISFIEASKGMYAGGLIITYLLFHVLLAPKVEHILSNKKLFDFLYIPAIYLIYCIISSFIFIANHESVFIFSPLILLYSFIEATGILFLRWIVDIK